MCYYICYHPDVLFLKIKKVAEQQKKNKALWRIAFCTVSSKTKRVNAYTNAR
jgi:hypothetical protein